MKETAVILLTGHRNYHKEQARLEAFGVSGLLSKPVIQPTLLSVMDTVQKCKNGILKQTGLITRLTVKEQQKVGQETVAPERFDGTGYRVLLVEDNRVNQKVAMRMLEKFGFRIDLAANGKEAVEMSGLLDYDLILMDCQMPEMDGYEATGRIRDREESGETVVPIIALTANAMKHDEALCLKAGMNDYLSKPINAKALQEKIRKWLKPKVPLSSKPLQ